MCQGHELSCSLSQGVLLRGADVYQPEGLAAKLMDASTLLGDADVGANLATMLATDAGRRLGSEPQFPITAGKGSTATEAPNRSSWTRLEAPNTPCNTQQTAQQASTAASDASTLGPPGLDCEATTPEQGSLTSCVTEAHPSPEDMPVAHKPHTRVSHTPRHEFASIMDPAEKLLTGVGSCDFNVLDLEFATKVHSVHKPARLIHVQDHHVPSDRHCAMSRLLMYSCNLALSTGEASLVPCRAMHCQRFLSFFLNKEASLRHSSSALQLWQGKAMAELSL
jgi:hypothetical protein